MAYAQDTIVDANAANVLAGVLDGLFIDAGFTVVETLTPGASTWFTKVYKSAGTDNQCGYDWYAVLMWNSVGTEQQVQLIAGAAYNAGTHVLSQIPGQFVATRFAEETTGAFIGAYNVNVQTDLSFQINTHSQNIQKPWFCAVVPSSAFGYWASITLDHFALFTTIQTNSYGFAATLDLDAGWPAEPFAVNESPLVGAAGGGTTYPNIFAADGMSAAMVCPPGATSFVPTTIRTAPIGSKLPILAGNFLPAYAWKPAYYLQSVAADVGSGTPPWDSPTFGDGVLIGTIIDFYFVYGGNIGDTVEIDSATYVLSGMINAQEGPLVNPYVAVLVE